MAAPGLGNLPPRKIASAAAVLVLHLVVLDLWLNASLTATFPKRAERETILYLAPPTPKQDLKPAPRAAPPRAHLPRPLESRAITVPAAKGGDDEKLQALGRALFDCRLDNFSKLTPQQQAACAPAATGAEPGGSTDFIDRAARIAGAALWARQKARKNGPLLLPCASNAGIGVGPGTLMCLGDGLVNGFKPDDQAMYGERPLDARVPNNGDPHPAYTDPDH